MESPAGPGVNGFGVGGPSPVPGPVAILQEGKFSSDGAQGLVDALNGLNN